MTQLASPGPGLLCLTFWTAEVGKTLSYNDMPSNVRNYSGVDLLCSQHNNVSYDILSKASAC